MKTILNENMAMNSALQKLLNKALEKALAEEVSQQISKDNLALTLVNLSYANKTHEFTQASFQGDVLFYPASLVKLFYLVAAYSWLQNKKLPDTAELRRAMHDMIVDSSNDATSYIVDLLTGTTSGPELPENEMKAWADRRNAINEYFKSCGYKDININQKPWGDGPYGRERVFVGENYTNRNMLTTNAVARLLVEVVTGKAVTKDRSSAEMLGLLRRDFHNKSSDPDDQASGFIGKALISLAPQASLWSKAGWTSTVRHDAAYIELDPDKRFVLVIFTKDCSDNRDIIPTLAQAIFKELDLLPL